MILFSFSGRKLFKHACLMVHGRLALLTWIQILFCAVEKNELWWVALRWAGMALCKYIWLYWRFPGNWVRDDINQMWNFRTACYYPAGDFSLTERLLFSVLFIMRSAVPTFSICRIWSRLSSKRHNKCNGVLGTIQEAQSLNKDIGCGVKLLSKLEWRDLFIKLTYCATEVLDKQFLHGAPASPFPNNLDNLPRMPVWLSITKMSLWPLEV